MESGRKWKEWKILEGAGLREMEIEGGVASTLMPMSWAAPLSSEQARMVLPILVLPVNQVSASMMTMQMRMVKAVWTLLTKRAMHLKNMWFITINS